MKKITITLISAFIILQVNAADILTLNNQMQFEGKLTKIKGCEVEFKSEGHKYIVPASDIFYLQFENIYDKVYTDYLKLADGDNCFRGQTDAAQFHGKQGVHVLLGVLFGPFAMLGTALSNPMPTRGNDTMLLSENKDLFSDPEYLKCYEKKAKGNLLLMEGIGWASWIVFVLVVSAGS